MDELLPPEPHASFLEPMIGHGQDPPLIMSGSEGKIGKSIDIGDMKPPLGHKGGKRSMNVLSSRNDTS